MYLADLTAYSAVIIKEHAPFHCGSGRVFYLA